MNLAERLRKDFLKKYADYAMRLLLIEFSALGQGAGG